MLDGSSSGDGGTNASRARSHEPLQVVSSVSVKRQICVAVVSQGFSVKPELRSLMTAGPNVVHPDVASATVLLMAMRAAFAHGGGFACACDGTRLQTGGHTFQLSIHESDSNVLFGARPPNTSMHCDMAPNDTALAYALTGGCGDAALTVVIPKLPVRRRRRRRRKRRVRVCWCDQFA